MISATDEQADHPRHRDMAGNLMDATFWGIIWILVWALPFGIFGAAVSGWPSATAIGGVAANGRKDARSRSRRRLVKFGRRGPQAVTVR
jgi:hypothetical protein